LDALLHEAAKDLERSTGSLLTESQARLVRRRLRAGEDRTSLDLSSLCLHHGDFWPGNVFIDDDETTVIDFEGWREGLPLEDVAYFTLQLELSFPFPLLRKRGGRYSAVFLETYVGADRIDSKLYGLCRVAKALQILSLRAESSGTLSVLERLRVNLLLDACSHD
jgi:aminoglycoside phosphotransferase (APT) family kinase protein